MEFEIVECPRDAMQGITEIISTEKKINYLKRLITKGFDVLDCGSFVNPSAVPQMADTAEVLQHISEFRNDHEYYSRTQFLVIVANERGAARASAFNAVDYLGFPFSVSEEFQRRNTNSTRENAFLELAKIQEIAQSAGKKVVAYISMGFGNPYDEKYSEELVFQWAERIASLGIRTISISDTTSNATPELIQKLYTTLIPKLPHVKFGAHLHAPSNDWELKIKACIESGVKRFDGAILGFGGCPFAKNDLVGNIPTEGLLSYLNNNYGFNRISLDDHDILLANQTYHNL